MNDIKYLSKLSCEERQSIMAKKVMTFQKLPPEICSVEDAKSIFKPHQFSIFQRDLDECVLILLEGIKFVLKDVGLDGSAFDWIERLVDLRVNREADLIRQRFSQTKKITEDFKKMPKDHPRRGDFIKEMKVRGIV